MADSLAEQKTARDAVRYLMPRRSVPEDYRPWAANRLLMPTLEIDAKEIIGFICRQPLSITSDEWLKMLDSHLISAEMADMLASGETIPFLKARDSLLRRHLVEFLGRSCEWGFEDTPSLSSLIIEDETDSAA